MVSTSQLTRSTRLRLAYPYKGATIRTRVVLHPFRGPLTQGAAPGFALHSALGYFILPFQGSGNAQPHAAPILRYFTLYMKRST